VKFVVLGAGQMGYAVAYDLIRSPRVDKLLLADKDPARIVELVEKFEDKRIVPCELDAADSAQVVPIIQEYDIVISCLPYRMNYDLAKAALEAGTHFCDLGSDEQTLQKIMALDALAKEHQIAIVPNCGLAPGLVSILAAAAAAPMEELYEMRLRAGGLPIEPELPPMRYSLVFSAEGLIDEYCGDTIIIRHGKVLRVPVLEELEEIQFPEPFGKLEAFSTGGNVATLPDTYGNRVQLLDYKTIRYPGHCSQLRLLRDLGLFSSEPVELDSQTVVPRELTRTLIDAHLPRNEPDVVLVRVKVTGIKERKPWQIVWEGIDYMDQGAGLSAMARMTAFPASIIAQMIAKGDISETGVLKQEECVPVRLFLAEMASRGIRLSQREGEPEVPPKL